ncbi:MAG: hypothetical protein ACOCVM_09220, partial [Desulfovibrionaceae bacterium]
MELQQEALAYLTLGGLAREDDEPLLRPKLHYFIKGLHGLWIAWEGTEPAPSPRLHFSEFVDGPYRHYPLYICRSCGQHFIHVAANAPLAVDGESGNHGVRTNRILEQARNNTLAPTEEDLYLTNRLVSLEEGEEAPHDTWLCRHCGALHDQPGQQCMAHQCRQHGELLPFLQFNRPNSCPACATRDPEHSPLITPLRSSDVYDVMILAHSMLTSMSEEDLRKVLVFADSRQDAAFQAGFMDSKSLRFRVRHLAYQILAEDPDSDLYFEDLHRRTVDLGVDQGFIPAHGKRHERMAQRLRWLLLEEFFAATERQRRNSLEQLGLARLEYESLTQERVREFAEPWLDRLQASTEEVVDVVHVVLDYVRQKHAVSEPMLRRYWTDRDWEVRQGIVSVFDFYRPQVVMETSPTDQRARNYVIGFRASRGLGGVEQLVRRAFAERLAPNLLNDFLEDMWSWLVQRQFLVPAEIIVKRYGRLTSMSNLDGGYQVNIDLVKIGHAESRYVCRQCGLARARLLPSGNCPAWRCPGH